MADGIELGKAYVQIVPSAKGIKDSIAEELGGESARAGESAGQLFTGKLVGTIKTVLGTAAIGKIDLRLGQRGRCSPAEPRRHRNAVQGQRRQGQDLCRTGLQDRRTFGQRLHGVHNQLRGQPAFQRQSEHRRGGAAGQHGDGGYV